MPRVDPRSSFSSGLLPAKGATHACASAPCDGTTFALRSATPDRNLVPGSRTRSWRRDASTCEAERAAPRGAAPENAKSPPDVADPVPRRCRERRTIEGRVHVCSTASHASPTVETAALSSGYDDKFSSGARGSSSRSSGCPTPISVRSLIRTMAQRLRLTTSGGRDRPTRIFPVR